MISFSDKGAEKVREFLAAQDADVALAGLRVGVRGGGCSGFQYQLAFDEQRESDAVFESHGLKLLVDNESLAYVRGAVIDYEESLQGAGFKVNNPNVVAACGCGSPLPGAGGGRRGGLRVLWGAPPRGGVPPLFVPLLPRGGPPAGMCSAVIFPFE